MIIKALTIDSDPLISCACSGYLLSLYFSYYSLRRLKCCHLNRSFFATGSKITTFPNQTIRFHLLDFTYAVQFKYPDNFLGSPQISGLTHFADKTDCYSGFCAITHSNCHIIIAFFCFLRLVELIFN